MTQSVSTCYFLVLERERKGILKLMGAYAVSGLFLAYRWVFFSVEALLSVNSKSLNPRGAGIKN